MTSAVSSDFEMLTGIEFVQLLAEGKAPRPPMSHVLPFTLMPPEHGTACIRATPEDRFLNLMRIVHGGWIMTMMDTVMGLAAHTTLAPGEAAPTHETSVKFVRPVTRATGELQICGRVLNRGRTLITLDGEMKDLHGRLYAHGSSTCAVVRLLRLTIDARNERPIESSQCRR